jgi:hypothetical protein
MSYPGYVIDVDRDDVFVRCMHKVPGRKLDLCQFYWPRCVRDECWYSLDNVICVIGEPIKSGGKYVVETEKWERIVQMYKK